MGPILALSLLLLGSAAAGPVTREVPSCSQACLADSKFQYSESTSYVYSYEASNNLRMDESSELTSVLKATVEITRISKCEMALQVTEASFRHGSSVETSSNDVENLKKHILRFSWSDGKISHICPHPEDTVNVNNIKRGILSALQNTMKTLDHDTIVRETDVLGSCDTEYKIKTHSTGKVLIHKKKTIATCTDHLKGRSGLTASFYDSPSSSFQHLPLRKDQDYYCHNIISNGIVEEVFCAEKATYKPISNFGYEAKSRGETKLQLLSFKASEIPAERSFANKEGLVYIYQPVILKNMETEAVAALQQLCSKANGLLDESVGAIIHKLISYVKGLPVPAIQNIYEQLKSKSLCQSPKLMGIFLDSLKSASSAGAVKLLTSLATRGEMNSAEVFLWLASMPFTSNPDENSVQAASPLLQKSFGNKQALLSVPAYAHKYCVHRPDCESSAAIQTIISELQLHLVNDCQPSSQEEEEEIITALKGFGNLGYFRPNIDQIFKCASSVSNSIPLRVAALESFRRTPCSDEVSTKLLEFYGNEQDDDEIRIAALIALSKCPSPQIVHRLGKTYNTGGSTQVEVFTWSYLKNLQSTSDPLRQKARHAANQLSLKTPSSVDITRFSRNFESSNFFGQLNMGYGVKANLIHSRESFLPRSATADLTVDIFGNQLNLLEVGVRTENFEHDLEKLFGPKGLISNTFGSKKITPNTDGVAPESYKTRIQTLKDKVGLKHKHPPKGSYYIRILGNEMRWRHVDVNTLQELASIDIKKYIKELSKYQNVDAGNTLLFLDNSIIIPSVTGRSYKLGFNGSATLGFQAKRKLEIHKLDIDNLMLNLDSHYKPSANIEVDESISIYGENYEPSLKIVTTLNAGHDFAVKVDMDKGPSLSVKLDYPAEDNRLLTYKRVFYEIDQNGEKPLQKPKSHNLDYCTKYINKVLGLEFCGSLNIPHFANKQGKYTVPFIGPTEASLSMKKIDSSMKGYEFKLILPDHETETKRFKLFFDTPNSEINRKFDAELIVNNGGSEPSTASMKIYSPLYHMEADATCLSKPDKLEVKVNAVGNGKRHYNFVLDMEKDIKGARLSEYRPTLTLTLPNRTPVTFTGTIVFSKGRKDLISFTINSDKVLNYPFSIKGNIGREGTFGQLDSINHFSSDITINALTKTSKLHATYVRSGLDVNMDVSLDCTTDNKNPQSVKLKTTLTGVSLHNPLSFTLQSELLTSEYPEFNFQTNWDFSAKLHKLLKNDITIRYGADFANAEKIIRFVQINKLESSYSNFRRVDFDNRLELAIPALKFDKSAFFTAFWDLNDKPKIHVNIGVKTDKEKFIKTELNFESYKRLSERPIKFTSSVQVLVLDYEFSYRSEAQETSHNIIQGREVLQTHPGHQITVDFVYTIRSTEQVFYHEYECTIVAPSLVAPVQHKMYVKRSKDVLEFGSNTNTGNRSPFVLDVKLNRNGPGEVSLDLPFLIGKLKIDNKESETVLEADFKTTGREPKQIVGTGNLVQEGDSRIINGNINYAGTINILLSGKINDNYLFGPHELRGDFSGSIEPMSIVSKYEIHDGQLEAFVKYMRYDSEKLSVDFKGKFIQKPNHLEFEAGVLLTSPYKAFDGKEIYSHFLMNSNNQHYNIETEYRLKPGALTGYVAKSSYNRKKGWPGHIKSNILLSLNRRTLYERNTAIIYGGGKYSFKTSISQFPGSRMNLESSLEVSAKYAAIQQSISTSFQHFQQINMNAIADFRNEEDYKVQSKIDFNSYKVYDFNATMSMRSTSDFDLKMTLFGNLTPSLQVHSKAQNANSLTKYSLSLEKDSTEIMSGKGEIKKRKKGFSGDITFNYKGKDFLTLNVNNDVKSQRERNYVLKFKSFYRTYSIHVHSLKDKKTVKTDINLCRNENDNCINISINHKEEEDGSEWQVTYKRADIEFNFDRIYTATPESVRRYFVVSSGGRRYGYDIRYGHEGKLKNLYLGAIFPAREMSLETTFLPSQEKPTLSFKLSSDVQNHPDRKLVIDIKFDNHIRNNKPSKLELVISHQVFEKPIEIEMTINYDSDKVKILEAETSLDYSLDAEDKILSKFYVEKFEDSTVKMDINMYHKDYQHLDFTMKVNAFEKDNKRDFAMDWFWKDENNIEKKAFVKVHHDMKADTFNLVYHRPKLDFRIEAAAEPSRGLHDNQSRINILIYYNGALTKTQISHDYSGHCYQFYILGEEEKEVRQFEICADVSNPVMFSIKTTSNEEDQLVFDYSLEIIRTETSMVNIRHHWNPEFLGGVVFQFTRLSEELLDAGFGTLPIHDSPRYQIMKQSFINKVIKPWKEFSKAESSKLQEEIKEEIKLIKAKAKEYYESLPTNPILLMVKRLSKVLKPFCDEIFEDMGDRFQEMKEQLRVKIQDLVNRGKELRQQLKDRCDNIPECRHLKRAAIERDGEEVLEALRSAISRLPENIRQYLEKGGKLETMMKKTYQVIKSQLDPILEYEAVKNTASYLEHHRKEIQKQILKLWKQYSDQIVHEVHDFIINRKIKDFLSAELKKVLDDIQNLEFESLRQMLHRFLEDILSAIPLPSIRSLFKINALDADRGVFNFDLNIPIDFSLLKELVEELRADLVSVSEIPMQFNWKQVLMKFKRITDLEFVPPYREHAMLIGNQHYVTFDKTFYDFDGECAYLLASDLEDGNFSLAITPSFSFETDKVSGERTHCLGVFVKDTAILVNLQDKSVKAGDQIVELPYVTKDLSVTRKGDLITIEDHHAIKVQCHMLHRLCIASMSGWYYGKTAGLFGTYDYEPANDFRRPKGQIPNSVTTFAKSWDISKGCKTRNLAPEVRVDKDSYSYSICRDYFEKPTSPLSACFSEVDPAKYFSLCYRHHSTEEDKNKALCDIAAAYVIICDKNYVELTLPPKCVTCQAPDGSLMKHGEKKKYEDFAQKSSETIFVIESHACNDKLFKDMTNLARAIDKELTNEGYHNNMFGIVGHGSDHHEPMVYTSNNKLFFGVNEVVNTVKRISQRSKSSDYALDAIRLAVGYPFSSATSKTIILLSCSSCNYNYKSLQYPVIQQILLEHEIVLHVINSQEIKLRKSTSNERNIIGADSETVYHSRDVTQRELVGEPALRSQALLPKDACVALAHDVGGSYFSTHSLSQETKSWRSIFARRMLKSAKISNCRWCDCTSSADHSPKVVCRPCQTKRPKLPFSVCTSCTLQGLLTSVSSYLLHLLIL